MKIVVVPQRRETRVPCHVQLRHNFRNGLPLPLLMHSIRLSDPTLINAVYYIRLIGQERLYVVSFQGNKIPHANLQQKGRIHLTALPSLCKAGLELHKSSYRIRPPIIPFPCADHDLNVTSGLRRQGIVLLFAVVELSDLTMLSLPAKYIDW
jgi:hypothetical protein